MPNVFDPRYEAEVADRIHAIVDQMLAPFGKSSPRAGFGLFSPRTPFDIAKPNQHDTKAEFMCELGVVEKGRKLISELLKTLIRHEGETERNAAIDRLREDLEAKIRYAAPKPPIETTEDMIRRNISDSGSFLITLIILVDLNSAMRERQKELDEQRDKFWNVPHRAPDYYARAIAGRLAKLYARETGTRPTAGSAPVTGAPSTNFTKALEQVFEVLEIKSGVRSPADWAIANLTDEDLQPPQNSLAGLNLGFPTKSVGYDYLLDMVKRVEE